MKIRNIKMIFGFALLISILLSGCSSDENSSLTSDKSQIEDSGGDEEENNKLVLKSFNAKTLDGNTFTHEDIYKNDVTLINFWSVTCGPCIREMPDIAEISKSLPKNVQIITVCLDGSYEMDTAKEILQESGFEGVTLISGDGDFLKVSREILYTPTTIIVDSEGNISDDIIIGGQDDLDKVYIDAINNVLKIMGKEEIKND